MRVHVCIYMRRTSETRSLGHFLCKDVGWKCTVLFSMPPAVSRVPFVHGRPIPPADTGHVGIPPRYSATSPVLLEFCACPRIGLMHTLDKIIFRKATPEIAVTESPAGFDGAVPHAAAKAASALRARVGDGPAGGSRRTVRLAGSHICC